MEFEESRCLHVRLSGGIGLGGCKAEIDVHATCKTKFCAGRQVLSRLVQSKTL